jgi:hypothetical protein
LNGCQRPINDRVQDSKTPVDDGVVVRFDTVDDKLDKRFKLAKDTLVLGVLHGGLVDQTLLDAHLNSIDSERSNNSTNNELVFSLDALNYLD